MALLWSELSGVYCSNMSLRWSEGLRVFQQRFKAYQRTNQLIAT